MTAPFEDDNNCYAIIYQITQECPLACDICLRFYTPGDTNLTNEKKRQMVDIFRQHNVRSVSVTGGEPLILGEDLFKFLRYLHEQHIHTALATTGFRMTKERLAEMDGYLDRMVISIRSLEREDWIEDFGNTRYTHDLYETVINLLQWVRETRIILEVTTVLHKEDVYRILTLGDKLAELNPNIVWRIDEYYPIGLGIHNKARFELEVGEFEQHCSTIREKFAGVFNDIRFSSWANRQSSPGLMVTQSGEIVTSDGNRTGLNILNDKFPKEFNMSRSWSEYKKVFRDWGWGDM